MLAERAWYHIRKRWEVEGVPEGEWELPLPESRIRALLSRAPESGAPQKLSRRNADGSVRVRIRFTAEEAALIEDGAGDTPLMLYIHRVLNTRARYHIQGRAQREEEDEL
jgi:hypothetical protein